MKKQMKANPADWLPPFPHMVHDRNCDCQPMSNEEFRARIAAICGPKPAADKPIVRGPSERGYHPPMHRCAWCGHMNHIVNECRCDPHNLPTSLPKEVAKALGFTNVEQMDEHQQWLRKHGTPEFKRWLEQGAPKEAA